MLPKLTAAEALERLRSRPFLVVEIAPAIWAVRDQRVREAIPLLLGYLRETDRLVVWDACVALGFLGAREAIPDLLDLLRPEAAAERGIVGIPDPFGWYEESPQESAIEGLKLLRATEALPALRAIAEAPQVDAYVRESAQKAIAVIAAPATAP